MIATILQVGLVWVVASVLVMVGLSVFVYNGGTRRRGRAAVLVFDDHEHEVVALDTERRNGSNKGGGTTRPDLHETAEPAITHQVTSDSGSLNRLLAGVQMPCGLERLQPDGEDDTVRMAFVTVVQEPRIVAVSLVDELERLGMEVEPLSYTEARAHRDGFELAVTIYLEPRRVIRQRRPAFPAAPLDSVVVEFTRV